MSAFIYTILWLILAACPAVGYFCFKTKQRAWITVIVITMIIDILVMRNIFR